MPKKKETAEEKATRLATPVPRTPTIPLEDYLSCGVTTINLAATGQISSFIPKGTYVYFVGDSSSGKTWFGFNLFAEAAHNKNFADYRLVFDNIEHGAMMNVAKYFGQKTADRIIPPRGTVEEPEYSETIQQFFYNLDNNLDQGPCLYFGDSMDALVADEDEEKFQEEKQAFEDDKNVSGSYGTNKAKYISRNISRVVQKLRRNGSILILISQTRDKIGGMIPGQKSRSGGKALKFYSHLELWTSVKGPIKKTVLGKEREIGSLIVADVQKNRLTGWEGKAIVPFHRSHGFDDLGACVDFLVDEGHWDKGSKGKIEAKEFNMAGSREAIITTVEEEGDQRELHLIVGKLWREIEEASAVKRKFRYS